MEVIGNKTISSESTFHLHCPFLFWFFLPTQTQQKTEPKFSDLAKPQKRGTWVSRIRTPTHTNTFSSFRRQLRFLPTPVCHIAWIRNENNSENVQSLKAKTTIHPTTSWKPNWIEKFGPRVYDWTFTTKEAGTLASNAAYCDHWNVGATSAGRIGNGATKGLLL